MFDKSKKRAVLNITVVALLILAFLWIYRSTNGSFKDKLHVLAAILFAFTLWANKINKNKGLSDDEIFIQNCGGIDKIAKRGKTYRINGVLFTAPPVIVFIVGLFMKSTTVMAYATLYGIILLPVGLYQLWRSKKCFNIVSRDAIAHRTEPSIQ